MLQVLLVCTANQCRSPMAEVLLQRDLSAVGVAASVSSAGRLRGDAPATGHAIDVVGELGLDLSAHRSRQLTAAIIAEADLILCMTREHVREVAVRGGGGEVLTRTFTLKDFVRRTAASPRAGRYR